MLQVGFSIPDLFRAQRGELFPRQGQCSTSQPAGEQCAPHRLLHFLPLLKHPMMFHVMPCRPHPGSPSVSDIFPFLRMGRVKTEPLQAGSTLQAKGHGLMPPSLLQQSATDPPLSMSNYNVIFSHLRRRLKQRDIAERPWTATDESYWIA
ncbi:hypothetical protein SKAU_G00398550 [Synaphobranchus kaupii]|uniref:Uncharacterized protein n=1 Tax=Synaphobranchus kaupii TaxID=118154 RepID=A0A9Q1IC54_SYNKA|nr:hypothetical protein SKAU_G00398550 [Synaphobranchus kaupii]